MKLNRHGIRFHLLAGFFMMALGIVILIGVLQTGLIRPYYRNAKIRTVSMIADTLQYNLIDSTGSRASLSEAMQETVDNNVCVAIYNDNGTQVYSADTLGAGCIFSASFTNDVTTVLNKETMQEELTKEDYSSTFVNEITGQEMLLYGHKVRGELANYYVFVNTALEPVDSVVSFYTRQYFIYTIVAGFIAALVAYWFSGKISEPLVKMTNEAKKLAKGDYSAVFDGGNLTETKELASTLNASEERLGKLEEMRRDLLANVSHDIRTPLTNIKAYAEMLEDFSGDDPVKRKKHLDVIMKETEYMNKLINDLSELSKMQSGSLQLHKSNTDLSELIYEIIEINQPMLEKRNLHLVCEVNDGLTVYADSQKVSQVIANYLSNAIKHSPDDKTIRIRAFLLEDEESVRLEVQDEGDGISADDLPYIWDRYEKTSKSFTRNQLNTGLGLAIVKGICEAHGARYGVESEEGKGSTFYVEFPTALVDEEEEAEE